MSFSPNSHYAAPRHHRHFGRRGHRVHALHASDSHWVMRYYEDALRNNKQNVYLGQSAGAASRSSSRITDIYRQALLDIYGEQFAKLASAPEIRIGVSHLPRWLGARTSVAARPHRLQHRQVRAQNRFIRRSDVRSAFIRNSSARKIA